MLGDTYHKASKQHLERKRREKKYEYYHLMVMLLVKNLIIFVTMITSVIQLKERHNQKDKLHLTILSNFYNNKKISMLIFPLEH